MRRAGNKILCDEVGDDDGTLVFFLFRGCFVCFVSLVAGARARDVLPVDFFWRAIFEGAKSRHKILISTLLRNTLPLLFARTNTTLNLQKKGCMICGRGNDRTTYDGGGKRIIDLPSIETRE
jgi:hypothetical protein